MIISGGMDNTMRIWNSKGENKFTSDDFNGWVSCMSLINKGKDSQLLAVGKYPKYLSTPIYLNNFIIELID